MDADVDLFVEEDGSIRFVHDDDVAEALVVDGVTQVTNRASHVEPAPGGGWTADLRPVGGPVLTGPDGKPFRRRSAALGAEVAWLGSELRSGRLGRPESSRIASPDRPSDFPEGRS